MERVYGTCVAINGNGVLFRGPTGSGKSDLALRVIESGGELIADDQTLITRRHNRVITSSPRNTRNKIEVRGVGILTIAAKMEAPLTLILKMASPDKIDRIPEVTFCNYLDVKIPMLKFTPFQSSASMKIKMAISLVKELTQ